MRRIRTQRAALLRWYDREARDLPWRSTRDPYAIWVSEVMLQQTRVETVIPYYERFMARFPSPEDLADADEDEVMALWSGLGYYRRARLLHRGVRELVSHYGGRVPADVEALQKLPGVGRYTAGAIGSIAFDLPAPILDGNVARVLARFEAVGTPLGRHDTERTLWTLAAAWARGPRPGALNQALMELGAQVCTPRSPACQACPLKRSCRARRAGTPSAYPVKFQRPAPRLWKLEALVATHGADRPHVWLQKESGALFGGLWSLPSCPSDEVPGDSPPGRHLLGIGGLSGRLRPEPLGRLTHLLSHRRLEVRVWRAVGARGATERAEALWAVPARQLSQLGISSLTKRLLRTAGLRF